MQFDNEWRSEHQARPSQSTTQAATAQQLTTRRIFEQMIEDEVRSGRLTPWRRRRIVRYAASLHLSAVEAGEIIESCRRRVHEQLGGHASSGVFKLPDPPTPAVTRALLTWFVLVLAIILNLLVLSWL